MEQLLCIMRISGESSEGEGIKVNQENYWSITMLMLKEVYSTVVEHSEIRQTWSDKQILKGHTVMTQCCDTTGLVKQGLRWLHN